MEWFIYAFQVYETATAAMNYLNYNEEYYDQDLRPSIFYILKWIEHTPRSESSYNYIAI